jgi:hypothetical protein
MVLAVAVTAVFLGWSWFASTVSLRFMRGRAPTDAEAALESLWQVHAAIVGLSIPLLVLLLELARSPGMLATTASQAMVSETWVVTVTALALLSVIEIGLVGFYLPSDGALVANVVFSTLVVLLILRGYWRALALMISPGLLRKRSEQVLLRRLEGSVQEDFVIALANDRLAQALVDWSPTRISESAIQRGEWTVVPSPSDGQVFDVRADVLRRLLLRVLPPVAVGQASTDVDGNETTGIALPFGDMQGRVLVTPIGDEVRQGEHLFALPGKHDKNVQREVLSAFDISALY